MGDPFPLFLDPGQHNAEKVFILLQEAQEK